MGEFTNEMFTKIHTNILTILMIGIQLYFCGDQVFSYLSDSHWTLDGLCDHFSCYFPIFTYSFTYMLINLGFEKLVQYKLIQKIYNVQEFIDDCSPHSTIGMSTQKKFSTFND